MHFWGMIGNLGINHIWRYFWFLHWQKLPLQPLASLLIFHLLVYKLYKSGLQIIHYILEVLRYTNIVYIGRYLVLTYIVRFFSTVCYFFGYICWSVNCMSWVSKFHNFFWYAQKLRQDLHLMALINALYGKLISNSPVLF